jgi:hypothetical protein
MLQEMKSETTELRLLELLDALVRSDDGAPGLEGQVAIGVRTPLGPKWWTVSFGARAEAGFADVVPPEADVALLLDEGAARSIVESGDPGQEPVLLIGDDRILDRFFTRYLKRQGAIALRASARPTTKPKRRR